ncbi:MAG TPA: hypothetical protein VGQ77_14045 [Methylomirabilota bacterium]|nr:hypothetical protein [Methylomirabilota bacterium]
MSPALRSEDGLSADELNWRPAAPATNSLYDGIRVVASSPGATC